MAEGGVAGKEGGTTITTALTNVRDITKCSRCQHQLLDPQTLQCLHSYCAQCLAGIDKSQKDGATGYHCPQCQLFTPEKDIRVYQLLIELLDAQKLAKTGPKVAKCERCGSKDTKWYCRECKKRKWLCDECKVLHDDFVEHQVVTLEEVKDENILVSKPLYCAKHVEYKIELYCNLCAKTLCVLCKINDHDGHKSEAFDEAVKRVIPQINNDLKGIKRNITDEQKHITQLEEEKEAVIEQYNQKIRKHEDKVSQHSQVLAWATTAMAKSTGAAFLQHFGAGLRDKVSQAGTICADSIIQASRCWPWERIIKAPTLNKTVDLTAAKGDWPYTRIAIIWDRIWTINYSSGIVSTFRFDGEEDEEFELDGRIEKTRTAVQYYSEKTIIASKTMLCTVTNTGGLIEIIQEGDFSDLCIGMDGKLNALEQTQGKVIMFEFVNSKWKKVTEINLQQYNEYNMIQDRHYSNTFVVQKENIYICMVSSHTIIQYNSAGEKLKVIASSTDGLSAPNVCGIGPDNYLLVANYNKKCILWLNASGEIIRCLECEANPWFAVYQNENSLWWLGGDKKLRNFIHE